MMEVKLYVGNLSRFTTQEELNILFTKARQVASVNVIKDRNKGSNAGIARHAIEKGKYNDQFQPEYPDLSIP